MDSACEIFQHSGGLSINEVGRGSEWLLEDPWQSQLDNGHPSPDAARNAGKVRDGPLPGCVFRWG